MIKKYLDLNGEELWEVYVNIRSQTSSIRVQKRLKGAKTEAQAKKQEIQLTRECERELLLKESKGISWSELLEKYELHQKQDFSSKLSAQTKADYVATIRKHTNGWMARESSGINPSDVRELFIETANVLSVAHQIKVKSILNKIYECLNSSGGKYSIDVVLVMPSSIKYEDMQATYESFAPLGIDTLMFTKLDETKGFGNIFSLSYETKKPISYFSVGQEVPEDLVCATSDFLIESLLNGFNRSKA